MDETSLRVPRDRGRPPDIVSMTAVHDETRQRKKANQRRHTEAASRSNTNPPAHCIPNNKVGYLHMNGEGRNTKMFDAAVAHPIPFEDCGCPVLTTEVTPRVPVPRRSSRPGPRHLPRQGGASTPGREMHRGIADRRPSRGGAADVSSFISNGHQRSVRLSGSRMVQATSQGTSSSSMR